MKTVLKKSVCAALFAALVCCFVYYAAFSVSKLAEARNTEKAWYYLNAKMIFASEINCGVRGGREWDEIYAPLDAALAASDKAVGRFPKVMQLPADVGDKNYNVFTYGAIKAANAFSLQSGAYPEDSPAKGERTPILAEMSSGLEIGEELDVEISGASRIFDFSQTAERPATDTILKVYVCGIANRALPLGESILPLNYNDFGLIIPDVYSKLEQLNPDLKLNDKILGEQIVYSNGADVSVIQIMQEVGIFSMPASYLELRAVVAGAFDVDEDFPAGMGLASAIAALGSLAFGALYAALLKEKGKLPPLCDGAIAAASAFAAALVASLPALTFADCFFETNLSPFADRSVRLFMPSALGWAALAGALCALTFWCVAAVGFVQRRFDIVAKTTGFFKRTIAKLADARKARRKTDPTD